jgi:hypothetical protein
MKNSCVLYLILLEKVEFFSGMRLGLERLVLKTNAWQHQLEEAQS